MTSTTTEALKKLVRNEGLIEAEPSLPLLNDNLNQGAGGSIYYGTGVTTPRALSIGLPFDTLGMMFVAEKLRRAASLENIYHHIADTHAGTNEWVDPQAVEVAAAAAQSTLTTVTENLGLSSFRIIRSSSFDSDPEYIELVQRFGVSQEHEYVRREMADMEWYRLQRNVKLKVGWIIQARETELGFDERRFDREYLRLRGPKLSFVYCKPGRTFDANRPKVSPYVAIAGESRLMLAPEVAAKEAIDHAVQASGDQQLNGARRHLSQIVQLYETLFGSFGRIPLEAKIQGVLDACFRK